MPGWTDISNWVFVPVLGAAGWGARRYITRHGRYTPLTRATLRIGLGAWFLTEAARSFYRPFIYANALNDWHVADTIGNTGGAVTAIFMILTLSGRGTRRDYLLIAGLAAGLVAYELMGPALGGSVDPWDVGATLVFGAVSFIVYRHLLGRASRPLTPQRITPIIPGGQPS